MGIFRGTGSSIGPVGVASVPGRSPGVPTGVMPAGLNIPTSLPSSPAPIPSQFAGNGGVMGRLSAGQPAPQAVVPGTTVPGTEGKGFGLSPGPGQADPAGTQRAAAQNLLGRMSTPERQFPISPIEGGGSGPGQADPMQSAIARAGGATNGFGYGR